MIGKKNIVFGFLYLVLTAALGPYMVVKMLPDVGIAQSEKQAKVGRLQQLKINQFEEDLEKLSGKKIAEANTDGILAINKLLNSRQPIDSVKSGAHAHGNLEALLNIAAGVVLCFIAVAPLFKQIISWIFIAGALVHSGSLYLLNFDQAWALNLLPVGPWLVLAGLLLIGIATIMGFKGEIVKD
ncbi:MAG: hypothetical protein OEY52_14375 [Gammaproteobacteria bacterium]|nr:hypothetical protein [Gammaproteobacteria bacterium]